MTLTFSSFSPPKETSIVHGVNGGIPSGGCGLERHPARITQNITENKKINRIDEQLI
jgi:hypothetical protein